MRIEVWRSRYGYRIQLLDDFVQFRTVILPMLRPATPYEKGENCWYIDQRSLGKLLQHPVVIYWRDMKMKVPKDEVLA
jgi:hypothetical protein